MRDIAQGFASGRRAAASLTALVTLVTLTTVAALAPPALAVTTPVTITTAFENTPISPGTSDAVGFAFTNSSSAPQNVTFTDSLPAGVTLDNPIAPTVTNGSSAGCTVVSSTAAPGASSLTVTITVPNSTGTVCTLSYSVVASTPSNDVAIRDAYSAVSTASATAVSETTGSLVVLSNPALSLTAPSGGQSFYLGQISTAAFACTASDPLDSIDSFFGTDDEGNQIESGAPIDTVDPGGHTLTVECYSAAGGGFVSQSVSYVVGSYSLSAVRAAKTTDIVSFKTTVPPSKLTARVFYGKKVVGATTVSPTSEGLIAVIVKPTNAGRKLLAGLKGRWANLKLQTSLSPLPIGTGDQEITPAGATVLSRTVKLPLAHPTKKAKTARKARPRKRSRASAPKRHARS